MNKKSVLQGLFIALFCLTMANSFGQVFVPVKGTANAVWDAANSRYLYTYQDISKDIMGTVVYNAATIYQCDVHGLNIKVYTDLAGQLKAPTGMFIQGSKLYVADWTKIWVLNLIDGAMLELIMTPGKSVQDIATDGVNIYTTDVLDSKIYWINMTTKAFDTLVCDTNGVSAPTGIYYEDKPLKSLFVCTFNASSPIQRYDFAGDSIYTIKRTSYNYCYGMTGDGKGNYYLSAWKTTAANEGTVYKFIGGFNTSVPLVDFLNFPADIIYQPIGDTVVIPELNKGVNTLRFIAANRDFIPPLCDTTIIVNPTTLTVKFNEPVNGTALLKTNYTGAGVPTSITLNAAKTEVTVVLPTALKVNVKTPFSVSNVQDLAKNAMKQPRTFDLVYKIKSIYDNNLKSGLTVYPNPVKNKININYELIQSATVSIELFDLMGQKVADFYCGTQNQGSYQLGYQLPKSVTSHGLYILKVTIDGQIFMSKILVD